MFNTDTWRRRWELTWLMRPDRLSSGPTATKMEVSVFVFVWKDQLFERSNFKAGGPERDRSLYFRTFTYREFLGKQRKVNEFTRYKSWRKSLTHASHAFSVRCEFGLWHKSGISLMFLFPAVAKVPSWFGRSTRFRTWAIKIFCKFDCHEFTISLAFLNCPDMLERFFI